MVIGRSSVPESKGNASDYLAAERTFLAWVRTALALMGFGFVVARFGLFLRELQIAQPSQPARGMASPIVLGTIVSVSSPWRYVRQIQDLNHGGTGLRHPSRSAIGVALVLAFLGAAMAVSLIAVWGLQ